MKTLLENWTKFLEEEANVEVPDKIEDSEADQTEDVIEKASDEADSIEKKLDAETKDPETYLQSLEIMIQKLLDIYKRKEKVV
jgi:hypothetical protein